MARQYSTGLRKLIASGTPLRQALAGARMVMYSTAQATDADTGVATSNILATLTAAGASFSGNVKPQWKATITAGTAGAANKVNAVLLGVPVLVGNSDTGSSGNDVVFAAGASSTNDYYNGMYIIGVGGTGLGNVGIITNYVGATLTATVSAINGTTWTAVSTDTDYIVIGGTELLGTPVLWATSHTVTAGAIVTQINSTMSTLEVTAVDNADASFSIVGPNAAGVSLNGNRIYVVVAGDVTYTTQEAATEVDGGPSVLGTANSGGMTWGAPDATTAKCQLTTTWQTGTGISYGAAGSSSKTGTLASFRILVDPADDGSTTSTTYPRIDGNIGTLSTNDLQVSSTARTEGDPIIISDYEIGVKATATA